MRRPLAHLCLLAWLPACAAAAPPGETPLVFTPASGEATEAYEGSFAVPENRAEADSRTLTLRYVRFPATGDAAGPPIVYLAGGPGGSGIETARGPRFALFQAMRAFGDVIALDQRGTGASSDLPLCVSSVVIRDAEPASAEVVAAAYRAAALECAGFWEDEGVDLRGYTTAESARDLDALREHLGAERITLWGISYGTHLALAAMREMGPRLDRAILASVEGLGQTVKLPARTDAYVARLQSAVDSQPGAAAAYGDVRAMMRRVHARLDAAPIPLSVAFADGRRGQVLLQTYGLQMITSALIADPEGAAMALSVYRELDSGRTETVSVLLGRFLGRPDAPITLSPMSLAMDVASGIGAERLALVRAQAATSLLADTLNFPMPQLAGALPDLDLGDAFRKAPASDVPTLILSGTLDGRTYPESAREAASGLSAARFVLVEGAGHNLFMTSPEVEAVERGGDDHDFIASQREIVRAVRAANPHVTIGVGWPQNCDLAPANLERWAQLIVRSGADYLALPTPMPNAVLTVIDMPMATEAQEVTISRRYLVDR